MIVPQQLVCFLAGTLQLSNLAQPLQASAFLLALKAKAYFATDTRGDFPG
jgi:hypothetical protein